MMRRSCFDQVHDHQSGGDTRWPTSASSGADTSYCLGQAAAAAVELVWRDAFDSRYDAIVSNCQISLVAGREGIVDSAGWHGAAVALQDRAASLTARPEAWSKDDRPATNAATRSGTQHV